MPPLHRAVAIAQIQRILVLVGKHLDFDVPRFLQVFLHVHRGIAEGRLRFGARGIDRMNQCCFGMHDAHAAAAAAARRLDDHRVTDLPCDLDDFFGVFGQRAVHARHHRYAGLFHRVFRADLVAHQTDGFSPGPDEGETALLDPFGEVGVFRKEAVAGMDGLGIGHLGGTDDRRDIEVTAAGLRGPDAYRLVGKTHVFGLGIRFGMHDHGLDAHFAAGALDAQCNFAAVGYENFVEHGFRSSPAPQSSGSPPLASRSARSETGVRKLSR